MQCAVWGLDWSWLGEHRPPGMTQVAALKALLAGVGGTSMI